MLTYQALVKKINEGIFNSVYLFYGDERFLQEELAELLAAAYLGEDIDFGREKVEGNNLSLEEVIARLSETGLFSERRLLIVDSPPYLAASGRGEQAASEEENKNIDRGTDFTSLLEDYINRHTSGIPGSILVFLASRIDRRKRLYKLIDNKGTAVECTALKGEALASWIRNKAGRLGKKIDRAAVEKLLMADEHNLHYISGELEKYSAYLGEEGKIISAQTVDTLFSGDIQGDIFRLSDAIAEGNTAKAHDILELLLRRREKPLLIFFMVVRHYRLLLQAHCLQQAGIPHNEFASTLEVHPFAARKLREQVVSFNRYALEEVLLALQKADMQIKTGQIESNHALRLILNRIAYIQDSACNGKS
ncbi:MAG: DNA polymerase III subunit delta [Bacillota bacterium]